MKVDADESGKQLTNYRTYLGGLEVAGRPALIVLGPHALAAGVPWLSWQHLRDAIRRSQTAHPYWIDFRLYLEDIGMADTYDEQVTDAETRVVLVSRNLVGKVARILARFASQAGSELTWPRDEQRITDAILNRWKDQGARAFTIAHNVSNHVGISAGAYHEPTTDDAWLGLWVWISPKRVKERQVVAATVVAAGDWDSEWSAEAVEWQVWGAYRRLTDFADSAAASTWLAEKLGQLRERGVFDLVVKLR